MNTTVSSHYFSLDFLFCGSLLATLSVHGEVIAAFNVDKCLLEGYESFFASDWWISLIDLQKPGSPFSCYIDVVANPPKIRLAEYKSINLHSGGGIVQSCHCCLAALHTILWWQEGVLSIGRKSINHSIKSTNVLQCLSVYVSASQYLSMSLNFPLLSLIVLQFNISQSSLGKPSK